MGYYSDVRVATTVAGFEKIKKLVPELYNKQLQDIIEQAKTDKKEIKQDKKDGTITIDHTIYDRKPYLKLDDAVIARDKNNKYVLFGFDGIKWMGYSHIERKAFEQAYDLCGEPVKQVCIGEDGESEDETWGDDDYDMPYLYTATAFDYDGSWEME